MTLTFLAAFLIVLGLLQLTSVYFGLRGASLTGGLAGPGMLFGILIFIAGVWYAVDLPLVQLCLFGILAVVPACLVLLLTGVVFNLGWHPVKNRLVVTHYGAVSIDEVEIAVSVSRLGHDAGSSQDFMPATFIVPRLHTTSSAYPVVLLICGAGDTRMSFKWRFVEECANLGMAVLTIDPPGHGDFKRVPMTVMNALCAANAAVEWLLEQPNISGIGVCGISFGGNIGTALAAENSFVKALALISTPVTLNPLTRRTYRIEALSLFMIPMNWQLLRNGSILTLWKEWRQLGNAQYGENLYDMISALDVLKNVRKVGERPVLVVHGTSDHAVLPSNAQLIFDAAIPAKDISLIRGATHVSPILLPGGSRNVAKWFLANLPRT